MIEPPTHCIWCGAYLQGGETKHRPDCWLATTAPADLRAQLDTPAVMLVVLEAARELPKWYVIWSIEHTAWWRPGRCGYTEVLAEAGRYSRAEAHAILVDANIVRVNECAIPLECVSAASAPAAGDPASAADPDPV